MTPLKLLINGARGRMGQMLVACARGDAALEVTAQIDVGDDLAAALALCDAAIDFSHYTTVEPVLARCVEAKKTLVIGTTGHTDAQVAAIKHSAAHLPLVFDLEVVEMHHRLKKDAPSGTAKKLAEILAEVRQLQYNDDVRHGRHGIVGERTDTEIGMHAVRGGDVVGDHTVIYAAQGERVELTHKASSRETFARGALRAALWAHGQPAGLYDMQDVLGLE